MLFRLNDPLNFFSSHCRRRRAADVSRGEHQNHRQAESCPDRRSVLNGGATKAARAFLVRRASIEAASVGGPVLAAVAPPRALDFSTLLAFTSAPGGARLGHC